MYTVPYLGRPCSISLTPGFRLLLRLLTLDDLSSKPRRSTSSKYLTPSEIVKALGIPSENPILMCSSNPLAQAKEP